MSGLKTLPASAELTGTLKTVVFRFKPSELTVGGCCDFLLSVRRHDPLTPRLTGREEEVGEEPEILRERRLRAQSLGKSWTG